MSDFSRYAVHCDQKHNAGVTRCEHTVEVFESLKEARRVAESRACDAQVYVRRDASATAYVGRHMSLSENWDRDPRFSMEVMVVIALHEVLERIATALEANPAVQQATREQAFAELVDYVSSRIGGRREDP